MADYGTAFEAFAAGFAAAFAAGYADSSARAREEQEHRDAEYLAYAIATGEDDIRDHLDIGYGPGEWYEDEGEWVQVPEFPGQVNARRRAEEVAARRRYDSDVADGKARFEAALTPQPKPRDTDFSLDLLSAFVTAYAIGAGRGACDFHLLPHLFLMEDLHDAAGVPPNVKAAFLAALGAKRSIPFRFEVSEDVRAVAQEEAANAAKSAAEFGFVDHELPGGNEACRIFDAGYEDGRRLGEENAYKIARRAAYNAVLEACDGDMDMAERVASAIDEAPANNAREARQRHIEEMEPGSARRAAMERRQQFFGNLPTRKRTPSPRGVYLADKRR